SREWSDRKNLAEVEQAGALEECALALAPADPARQLPQASSPDPLSMLSGRSARQVVRAPPLRGANNTCDRLELMARSVECAAIQQTHTAGRRPLVVPASPSRPRVPPAPWPYPPSRLSPGADSGSLCSKFWLVHERPDPGLCAPESRVYARI